MDNDNRGTMTISGATIANNSAAWVRRALDPPPPHARVALRGPDTSVAGVRGSPAAAWTIVAL